MTAGQGRSCAKGVVVMTNVDHKQEAQEQEQSSSEFGKGLTYCLGLFLAHQEKTREFERMESLTYTRQWDLWFNGASDHLCDLQIPPNFPIALRRRLEEFQTKCLNWGHGYNKPEAMKEDVWWAIREAKNLLIEIDKQFGIPTCKGQWE